MEQTNTSTQWLLNDLNDLNEIWCEYIIKYGKFVLNINIFRSGAPYVLPHF